MFTCLRISYRLGLVVTLHQMSANPTQNNDQHRRTEAHKGEMTLNRTPLEQFGVSFCMACPHPNWSIFVKRQATFASQFAG